MAAAPATARPAAIASGPSTRGGAGQYIGPSIYECANRCAAELSARPCLLEQHLGGAEGVVVRAVADLAESVVSPAPDPQGRREDTGMVVPGADALHDVVAEIDNHRRQPIGRG